MGNKINKLILGGLAGGIGYLFLSKKGKELRKAMQEKLPELMKEVKTRYDNGRKTFDDVLNEVVDEWEGANKLLHDTVEPLKKEIRKRNKK